MKRVTTMGKQVLFDGRHLADARDERSAEVIAICLNRATSNGMQEREIRLCGEFFA